MRTLLDGKLPFYKANMHTHTTLSDGAFTPEEIKELYKSHGYSVVAYTDHEHIIDNSHLSDDGFLAITSCELAIKEIATAHTGKNQRLKVCHLNFYALDPHNITTPCYSSIYDHFKSEELAEKGLVKFDEEYVRVYSHEGISEMIRLGREKGFIVSYNHPNWSLENACDYLGYEGLFAIEIFNNGINVMGFPDDERAYDDMLRSGKKLYCTACDDTHKPCDLFGGWIMINAERLDYKTVMDALQSGNFYASTGPEIYSLTVDGGKAKIKFSPASRISIITCGRVAKTVIGDRLTEAEFELDDSYGFFRIRVEDKYGKKAYTQSYDI